MRTVVLSILAFVAVSSALNINTAPVDSLSSSLPGVGKGIATQIELNRREAKFVSCQDVQARVRGIGDKKIAVICPLLTF